MRNKRMQKVKWLALALSVLALGPVWGGDTLLIQGGNVFDPSKGKAIQADVLVRDGRIAEVARQITPPADANVVDANGLALLPGLFDVHTHWTPAMSPSSSALVANAYLAAGVTSVGDFHQAPEAWAPRRQWLAKLKAPQVMFAARISTPLGHGADWADQATTRWVNSPEAAREAVRALLPYQPDLIKVFTDGWRYGRSPDNTSMDEWTLTALVEEAHQHHLKVATHTVTVARAKVAVKAGVDILAHSILDAPVDAELIALMRMHKTAYAPTLAVYEPIRIGDKPPRPEQQGAIALRERNYAQAVKNLRKLHRAGITIVLGTDAGMTGTPHGRSSLHELELMVQAGLSPAEALRAGTLNSARALAKEADSGVIAVGKRADFVLVEGAPWRNIAQMQQIRQVYLQGQRVVQMQQQDASIGPNTQAWPEAQVAVAQVDDAEQERTSLDTLRTGEADAGNDRSWQVIQRVPREGGGHAIQVTAELSSKPDPRVSLVLPLQRGSVMPTDVRAFRGIEFQVRGEITKLALQLRGMEQALWQAPVRLPGAHWQTVRIPLQQAKATRWNGKVEPNAAAWNGEPLRELVLVASGPTNGQLWYEVDNVRFYP